MEPHMSSPSPSSKLDFEMKVKRSLKLTIPHSEKISTPNKQQKATSSGRSFASVQMFHTLDKNGSLYDPAGTES